MNKDERTDSWLISWQRFSEKYGDFNGLRWEKQQQKNKEREQKDE